ncbi:hypothetical protein LTR67_008605 [Exophiala xenobiotica]
MLSRFLAWTRSLPLIEPDSQGAAQEPDGRTQLNCDYQLRNMETDDWDAETARVAFTQQLQDIQNALRNIPESSEYAATLRNEAAAINLQMQEVEALEARQSSQRMQHSMYRAMLSDLPHLSNSGNPQGSTLVRRQGQGRAGETAAYEDCRVNPDGSTPLEDYIERLRRDEQPRRECYICTDQVLESESVVFGECPHSWCHGCLRRAFDLAIKNNGGYPVRCCIQLQSIPLDNPDVALALGDKMISDMNAKIVEYTTQDRTYCYQQTCSTFITPDTISDRIATCPTCQQRTCASCKGKYHDKPDCSTVNDEAFEHWRDENGTATCPGCHHAVEITYGCNHMSATGARCGSAPDVDATTETSTTIGTSTKRQSATIKCALAAGLGSLVLPREREIVFGKAVALADIGKSGIHERGKSIGYYCVMLAVLLEMLLVGRHLRSKGRPEKKSAENDETLMVERSTRSFGHTEMDVQWNTSFIVYERSHSPGQSKGK